MSFSMMDNVLNEIEPDKITHEDIVATFERINENKNSFLSKHTIHDKTSSLQFKRPQALDDLELFLNSLVNKRTGFLDGEKLGAPANRDRVAYLFSKVMGCRISIHLSHVFPSVGTIPKFTKYLGFRPPWKVTPYGFKATLPDMAVEVIWGVQIISNVTPRTFIGVTFHEIGHNINAAGWLSKAIMVYAVAVIAQEKELKKLMMTLLKGTPMRLEATLQVFLKKTRFVEILNTLYLQAFGELSNSKRALLAVNMARFGEIIKWWKNVFTRSGEFVDKLGQYAKVSVILLFGMGKFSDEDFCDGLATAYGYGPDLIEGLVNMSKIGVFQAPEVMEKVKKGEYNSLNRDKNGKPLVLLSSNLFETVTFFMSLIGSALDVHPSTYERAKLAQKRLEAQIKAQKDPVMKRMAQEQYDSIRFIIDDYEKWLKTSVGRYALSRGKSMFSILKSSIVGLASFATAGILFKTGDDEMNAWKKVVEEGEAAEKEGKYFSGKRGITIKLA